MDTVLYIEANIMCLFILIILRRVVYTRNTISRREHMLIAMMILIEIILITDSIAVACDGILLPGVRILNIAMNTVEFACNGLAGTAWVMYVAHDPEFRKEGRHHAHLLACCIPAGILTLLCLTSQATKFVFYVDAANHYQRGIGFFVISGITLLYVVFTMLLAARRMHSSKNAGKRQEYKLILFFGAFPIIGGTVQMLFEQFPGIPGVWPATVCALLMLILNLQRTQMYLDALTGIYNRGRFNQYLSLQIQDLTKYESLYLVLMDIDHFKEVNDTYGHLAGDECLVQVADCLKRATADTDYFVARYGGDEFAMVCRCRSEDEALNVIKRVRCELRMDNDKLPPDKPKPALSIGYAASERGAQGVLFERMEKLISAADASMYEVKRQRHEMEQWGKEKTVPAKG